MDFSISPELEEFRNKVRSFALREFTEELKHKHDDEESYPEEIRKKVFKEGLVDVSKPWEMLITMEEFCRVDPGLGLSSIVSLFGNEILMFHGSDYQREKYLEKVWKGDLISGFAVTEPNAGSDVAGISSYMKNNGDGTWLLNGGKMFITNGTIADIFLTLVRSSPVDVAKKHHGLSMVIVEKNMKGFSANKIKGKMGVRATNTGELSFDNVVIPESNIVGEIGKGFYYVMEFFNISRIYVAAQAVGIAQGALDYILNYVAVNKKTGNDMADKELTSFLIAEVTTRVEAARLLTYRAASLLFKFTPDPVATSIAKYYAAETATYATEKAMELLGIDGVTTDLERLYRDAKITEIWEGTSEIEKLTIARMLIKNKIKEVEQHA